MKYCSATNALLTSKTQDSKLRDLTRALEDVPQDLADIEGAILDINIGGASAYRLIDRRLEMNIPVILYTGCDIRHDPQRYATLPRVSKPNSCFDAVRELIRQLAN